ncbi:MAG: DNA-binding response regulator [Alphaproteobacteria bacterium]|jgi:two-component system response regulator FixJ|nr:DNA-binding response regulator [Alphaproteobacteria bacterium]
METMRAGRPRVRLLGRRLDRLSEEARILEAAGFAVEAHGSAEDLMAAAASDGATVCALVDGGDGEADGMQLLQPTDEAWRPLPVILVDDPGPVDRVVARLKAGATDYLVRPIGKDALIASVRGAQALIGAWRQIAVPAASVPPRLARLTAKEREVLELLARGLSSKEMARELGISHRTVEVHRGRVIAKMGARNGIDLVRLVLGAAAPAPALPARVTAPPTGA